MIASFLLSSTVVPVLAARLLRTEPAAHGTERRGIFTKIHDGFFPPQIDSIRCRGLSIQLSIGDFVSVHTALNQNGQNTWKRYV